MKTKLIITVTLITSSIALSQLKSQLPPEPNVSEAMLSRPQNSMLLGFINPNNFRMFHSYNMSFNSFGGNSVALGVYTNSMFYQITDPLSMQVDVSLVHSPYNSFGKEFQNDFNGIYVSRAALNWRPTENFMVNIEYRNMPIGLGYLNPYYRYSRYGNYFYDMNGFNDWYIGR
jgi:hypothetical protein